MTIDSNINRIVSDALSLQERIALGIDKLEFLPTPESVTMKHMQEWCENCAGGNNEIFDRRLRWDNLSYDQAKKLVGKVRIKDYKDYPEWGKIVGEILEHIEAYRKPEDRPIKPKYPVAFEDALLPIVLFAREKIFEKMGFNTCDINKIETKHFSIHAYLSLEYHLLQEISDIVFNCLFRQFQKYKKLHRPVVNKPNGLYLSFCNELIRDGYPKLFKNYPALARLIALRVMFWVGSSSEFILRLDRDINDIRRDFFKGQKIGNVYLLIQSIGDQHDEGRSVVVIEFDKGQKIVYKPRNIDIYQAFNNFASWININIGKKTKVITPKVLVRSGYGWVEYMNKAKITKTGTAKYFFNVGFTISYLYLLNSNDMHYENILRNGDDIVPIDIENIINGQIKNHVQLSEKFLVAEKCGQKLDHTILKIGFLPRWGHDFGDEKNKYSTGYLFPALTKPKNESKIANINLDTMVKIPAFMSAQVYDKYVPDLSVISKNIGKGFDYGYRYLIKNKTLLSSNISPLEFFNHVCSRSILRHTRTYYLMMKKMQNCLYFKNAMKKSIYLEALRKATLVNIPDKDPYWKINSQEIESMECGDIPLFTAKASSKSLYFGKNSIIDNFFQQNSLEYIRQTLNDLSMKDLKVQKQLIEQSLLIRWAHKDKYRQIVKNTKTLIIHKNLNNDIRKCINATEKNILSLYFPAGKNIAFWSGIAYQPALNRYLHGVLEPGLYDGSIGIVLFLAQIDVINKTSRHKKIIDASLCGINQQMLVSISDIKGIKSLGISGLGGVIYGLTKIHRLLPETKALEYATDIMNSFDAKNMLTGKTVDVINGAAGLIFGLVNMYKIKPSDKLKRDIEECVNYLDHQSLKVTQGATAWITLNPKKPLTGFSHGAAGIAYAISLANTICHKEKFSNLTLEAIRYEQTEFLKEANTWPDYRKNNINNFPHAWCHGSAGIGIARIGILSNGQEDGSLYRDLSQAVENVIKFNTISHCLCCGMAGQADFLLSDYIFRGEEKSKNEAEKKIIQMVGYYNRFKSFNLSSNLPNFGKHYNNLFLGNAGIAYVMLRYLYPKKINSILLWQ